VQAGGGVPFGFAQGRLSTAFVLRVREAQTPLRMTGSEGCCEVLFDLLIFSARNPWEFNLVEDRERG
jgi:hypothetical protein